MLNITKSLEIMDALLNTKAKPTNVVSFPVNPYLALFTTVPDDNGQNGVEPTSEDYRRVLLNKKGFDGKQLLTGAVSETREINGSEKVCSVVKNQEQILFPEALNTGYGQITGFGIFDAAEETANLIAWGTLTSSQTINQGEIPIFRIGEFEMMLA